MESDLFGNPVTQRDKKAQKRAYNKVWYLNNRDRIKAKCAADRDRISARKKAYYQANREKILGKDKTRHKVYYRKNRDKWKARYEANREKWKAYHKKNSRRWHLKSKYGLSPDQFDKLLEAQNRKCAICETENLGRIAIDHCHISGHVRGILCERCNQMIGFARNSTRILASAMKYLSRELIFNPD